MCTKGVSDVYEPIGIGIVDLLVMIFRQCFKRCKVKSDDGVVTHVLVGETLEDAMTWLSMG